MTFSGYTKRNVSIIKGFAILCIVFHNYFHWLAPSPGENEFDFTPLRVQKLFHLLGEQPGEFVNILLSYFGHFGVQLFIMLSGFGLVMSMMNRPRTWESFVLHRLKQLYPLVLTGIVFFLFYLLLQGEKQGAWNQKELGYKMLLIHTLIPNSGLSLNGPWWFFGLIFQLYLLFPLLYRCMKKWGWKAFLVVCVISYGLIFLFRENLNLYHGSILMQNAPGHLPEFCFGMMLAFSKDKKIHWAWLLLAIVLFVWGNFAPGFYPFTFLAITVISVFGIQLLKRWRGIKWIRSGFNYFGGLSMVLFATHGFFREPVLNYAGTQTGAGWHLLTALLYFLLVWGVALAAKPLYETLVSLLNRIHIRENRLTRVLGCICATALGLFFAYVGSYYLRQNLSRHPSRPLANQLQVENGRVLSNHQYFSLARIPLEENDLVMHMEGSFDLKEGVDFKPCLVADIQKELWKVLDLKQTKNGEWTHCEFSYDYLRPFTNNIVGKDLKLYFWNKDLKEADFQNFTVSVTH